MTYGIERGRLVTDSKQRLAVWRLQCEQRQAYNRAVELCLTAVSTNKRIPSVYDLHAQLTKDRKSGVMPGDVSVLLQRAGLNGGRETVVKWHEARMKHDRNVVYWAIRLAAAQAGDSGDEERAAILRKAGCIGTGKKTIEDELNHCEAKLDAARTKRDNHLDKGTHRLYRSRKRNESDPDGGPSVEFNEGVTLRDGKIHIPKGPALTLARRVVKLSDGQLWDPAEGVAGLPDGWRWTGAVQIVDTTRRITRRTRPEHRRYVVHVQLKRANSEPPPPEFDGRSLGEVLGVDPGCATAMAVSDGRKFDMPDETAINAEIKAQQRRMSRLTNGSRAHKKASRKYKDAHRKRSNRRENAALQMSAAIASTEGIAAVGCERPTKNMRGSAKGTVDHPGEGVAAKRGLNRMLSDAWFNGIRPLLERACYIRSVRYLEVDPRHTSQHCSRCGHSVVRKSQLSYWCMACAMVGDADLNAARNIAVLTELTLLLGEPVNMGALMAPPAVRVSSPQRGRAGGIPVRWSCALTPGPLGTKPVVSAAGCKDSASPGPPRSWHYPI